MKHSRANTGKLSKLSHRRVIIAVALGVVLASPLFAASAAPTSADNQAQSFDSWLRDSQVTGEFRTYYFGQNFERILPYKHSASIGGWLNFHTPSAAGFSLDFGLYTAQSMGRHSPAREVPDLPAASVTALGQAYVQYEGHGLLLRLGNQPINTPMVATDDLDTRMIPPLYRAIGGSVDLPFKGLKLYGYRATRFKPWQSAHFGKGDTGINPFNGIAAVPEVQTSGFSTAGLKLDNKGIGANLWYYHFNNRLDAAYADLSYKVSLDSRVIKGASIGLQYAEEWNTSNQKGLYQDVRSTIRGVKLGVSLPHNNLALGYNNVPNRPGRFRSGGFVSPYQQGGYDSHTFYADDFGVGPVDGVAVPGKFYRLSDAIVLPSQHLFFLVAYTRALSSDSFQGTHGLLSGPGGRSNNVLVVAKYGFAKNWAFKVLGDRIQKNGGVGTVKLIRGYVTYSFGAN